MSDITENFTTMLATLLLVLVFGFFTPLLNCDLQLLLTSNIYAKHLVCFVCIFFLISILIAPVSQKIWITWLQTVALYIVFLLATKSTLVPIMIVLILLCIDQTLRLESQRRKAEDDEADITMFIKIRTYILYLVLSIIVIGCGMYYIKKRKDYGEQFSSVTFLFGSNTCKSLTKLKHSRS
jgi:hypothetical protein